MRKKKQNTLASKYWFLILAAVCLLFMGLSLISDEVKRRLRTIANYTVVPMQKGINQIRDVPDRYYG